MKTRTLVTEEQVRKFWATHDSTDYVDWKKAKKVVLPKLKPSVKSISLRLPESMIEALKLLANKHDIPYQSLMKMFLAQRVEKESRSGSLKSAAAIHKRSSSSLG